MDRLKVRFLAHNLINLSYLIGIIEEKIKNNKDKEDIIINLDISQIFIEDLYNDESISDEFKENYQKLIDKLKKELETGKINKNTEEKLHKFIGDLEKEVTNNIIYYTLKR